MKINKHLLNALITFVMVTSAFFISAPVGHAQTDQDWSEPVNLSFSGGAINPRIVVDFRGTIHAIWFNEVNGYQYSRSPDGVTWMKAQTVIFPFGEKDLPPVFLADADGSIHIFWISSKQGLFYGRFTPSEFSRPDKWKTTSLLAGDVMGFDVVLDAEGAIHLAYIQNGATGGNPAGVYYLQSVIGGGSWFEAIKLYESEYLRSIKKTDAYVRISSSNSLSNQRIYVTWDDRALKRVFMAVSEDSGFNWSGEQQIKGPGDTGGIDTPFNLTVSAFEESVLLIWQAGEPGSALCTVYSQWSEDGGNNWGETLPVLGGRSECPLDTIIIGRDGNTMSVKFNMQVNPILAAWNGEQWSEALSRTQLPTFSNPLTFDAILWGCRFDLFENNHLYVVVCDQGKGGDVWFLSRTLEPVENWFSPSAYWGDPIVLSLSSENPLRISNLSTVADIIGNVHAMWVQSPIGQGNVSPINIGYARWDGNQWSNPDTVISSLSGIPLQLLTTVTPSERLLLTWIDGYNGDLVSSWANSTRANFVSEWSGITGLPVPSRLVNSTDVVVDGSGRIINAYAVPTNEKRGIYVVQSSDNGVSWSIPVLAFDAVAKDWERIEQPKIGLGADGILHLIFIRDTIREGQQVGLYYSRSLDGGMTWSEAKIFSNGQIQWADITVNSENTVHVVWQEFDGLVFANTSQFSQDGGVTWRKQPNVTGVNDSPTSVSLASDGNGVLHFVQLVNKPSMDTYHQKILILQDWKWDGARWNIELAKNIILRGEEINYSLSADITSTGFLWVFIPVEYTDFNAETKTEILTFGRFLEEAENGSQGQIPILPMPVTATDDVGVPTLEPTTTPDSVETYPEASSLPWNIVGLGLIGVVVTGIIFFFLRRKPVKRKK